MLVVLALLSGLVIPKGLAADGTKRTNRITITKIDDPVSPPACPDDQVGWFGANCSYLCHCKDDVDCDKVDGACSSGCGMGWFGPGCQYETIVYRGDSRNNSYPSIPWLVDQDDSTCNPGTTVSLVLLNYIDTLPWIRLVRRDTSSEPGESFSIQVKYLEPPSDWLDVACYTVPVDEITVDMQCESRENTYISHFRVSGPAAKDLCSLYINAGRNVGLKQPTQQSSTYNVTFNDQQDWSSDKAVDGSIHWGADPIELHAGSCSRTQLEHPSWWKVTFTRNMHVQRIRVKDQVYTMPIETDCPDGYFGWACQSRCNCAFSTSCFVHSGGCPAGCAPGYTGGNCNTQIEQLTVTNPSNMSVIQEVVGGREEDELYIECSADIVGVPPEVIIIETLQIFKSQPGKNGISLIKQSNQATSMIPETGNRAEYLPWSKKNPDCSDAGIYQCTVTYLDSRLKKYGSKIIRTGQHRVAKRAETRKLLVSLSPYRPNNRYSQYDELKVTCTVEGPINLKFIWRAGLANNRDFDILEEGITTSRPIQMEDGTCDRYLHKSMLILKKPEDWTNGEDYFLWCSGKYKEDLEISSHVKISFSKYGGFTKCPSNWHQCFDKCVRPFSDKLSWEEARGVCHQFLAGTDLLKITDAKTNRCVWGKLNDLETQYWIGLKKPNQKAPYQWIGGENANYVNWRPNQPKHTVKACGAFFTHLNSHGKWRSSSCSTKRKFICEKPLDVVVSKKISCPYGWTASPHTENCVKIHDGPQTWEDAKQICKSERGELVYIVDEVEHLFLIDLISLSSSKSNRLWIGLRRPNAGSKFLWLRQDEENDIDLWENPNGPPKGDSKMCVATNCNDQKKWCPMPCEAKLRFVCNIRTPEVLISAPERDTASTPVQTTEKTFEPGIWGDPIMIECSAGVTKLPQTYSKVEGLGIKRRPRNSAEFEKIIEMFPYHPLGHKEIVHKKSVDQSWHFEYYGTSWDRGTPTYSRDLTIEWTLKEPVCGDDGVYECTVYYRDGDVLATRSDQTSWRAFPPHHQEYRFPDGYRFMRLDYVALAFVLDGPKQMQLEWESSVGPIRGGDFTDYQGKVEILMEEVNVSSTEKCGLTRHKSTLVTQLPETGREYRFRCFAKDSTSGTPDFLFRLQVPDDDPLVSNPAKLTPETYIKGGKPFVLTCNSEVIGLDANNKTITHLWIYRFHNKRDYTVFAIYRIIDPIDKRNKTPDGRNFTFKYIGNSSSPEPATIQWTIEDPQMNDTGTYQCRVDVSEDEHVRAFRGQQFLATAAPTRNIQLSISPAVPHNEYITGDTLHLICTVDGPPKLRLVWSWRAANGGDLKEYVRPQDIVRSSSPIENDEFGAMRHKSELTLPPTWKPDNYTLLCEARFHYQVELSVNLSLAIFKNCLTYKMHCLSAEHNQNPGEEDNNDIFLPATSDFKEKMCLREPRCRDVSTHNCPTHSTELNQLDIMKRLHEFHCSITGQKVLTEMRSSSCIKDVRLMKKLHKGIKDCDGTLLRTAIATKLEGKLNNQTFCQLNSKRNKCAADLVEKTCEKAVALYAQYVYGIHDDIEYSAICSNYRNVLWCGNELLGVGLADTDVEHFITHDSKDLNMMCKSWQACSDAFRRFNHSSRSEDYKFKAKQDMITMNLACSQLGKRTRSSPCKKGTEEYQRELDDYNACSHGVDEANRYNSDHCVFVQGWVKCVGKVATSECGQPLTMHLTTKYALYEVKDYEKHVCPGGRPPCWWICEDLFPKITSHVAQPFAFAWIQKIKNNMGKICGSQDAIKVCWNIREMVCPDSVTKEEISNWRQLLDFLCSDKAGFTEVLKTDCVDQTPLVNQLDAKARTCNKEVNEMLRTNFTLEPTEQTCKLLEDAKRCTMNEAMETCGFAFGGFISKMWSISLEDDVAAVMNQCYDCLGITQCIGQILIDNKHEEYDLIGFFLAKGAESLANICWRLLQCLGQDIYQCKRDPYLLQVKEFVNTFCSENGWNVIASAHNSYCLSADVYAPLKREIDSLGEVPSKPMNRNPQMCRAIIDQLNKIAEISDQRCGTEAATFIAQAYSQSYALKYHKRRCKHLDNRCWQLKGCLEPFVDSSSTIAPSNWILLFKKISTLQFNNLCFRYTTNISECYINYGQFCRDHAFVTRVEIGMDVLTQTCSKYRSADQTEKSNFGHHLFKTILSLSKNCERGFYDSLAGSDRGFFLFNNAEDCPNPSEDLCRKIESTERECVMALSKLWLKNKDTIAASHKIWVDIWLKIMGHRFMRVRDTCYGINPCPQWSIRSPHMSTCLVIHGNEWHQDARSKCQKNGGDLVKISDLRMFLAVSDFLTDAVSGQPSQHSKELYSFWIHDESDLAKWVKQIFPSKKDSDLLCPVLTRLNAHQFWYPRYKHCNYTRAYVICEQPTYCKASCPTGWRWSPTGALCVKALDSLPSRDKYSAVCEKDGMSLFEYSNLQSSRFIYDLLPLDPSRKFWVKLSDSTLGNLELVNDYVRFKESTGGTGPEVLPSICASVNIKFPRQLKSENCSNVIGGICTRKPIQCSKGPVRKTRPTPKKDGCSKDMFEYQNVCLALIQSPMSWTDARKKCQADKGDLVEIATSDNRKRFYILGLTMSFKSDIKVWIGLHRSKNDGLYRWLDQLNTTEPTLYGQDPVTPTKLDKAQCLMAASHTHGTSHWTFKDCSSQQWSFCEYPNNSLDAHQAPCTIGWLKIDKSTCIKTFIPGNDYEWHWSGALYKCRSEGGQLLDVTEARWTFLREHVILDSGDYFIGLNEQQALSGVACRSISLTSNVNRTLAVIETSVKECGPYKADFFICERPVQSAG